MFAPTQTIKVFAIRPSAVRSPNGLVTYRATGIFGVAPNMGSVRIRLGPKRLTLVANDQTMRVFAIKATDADAAKPAAANGAEIDGVQWSGAWGFGFHRRLASKSNGQIFARGTILRGSQSD